MGWAETGGWPDGSDGFRRLTYARGRWAFTWGVVAGKRPKCPVIGDLNMAREFEQQPKESAKAFAAFSVYLNMGAERSLEAVGRKLGKSGGLVQRWSSRWRWAERVDAHAAHLATVEREAVEVAARGKAAEWAKRQDEVRQREWEMHEKCIGAAKKAFDAFMAREKVYANLADIAAVPNMPTGADILQMALGFEANADKRLRSKINLQNGGVRFEFVQDEDKDTRASMEVFQRFTLGLPVFEGSSSAYPLEARLKYREKEGKVTFWFELIRPDRVFKDAVNDELNRIKDATGFPVIAGKP